MYAYSKQVAKSFDDAMAATKQALAERGFGVLAEIDVRAKLKEKTGEDVGPYVILGACNPHFAGRALALEPLLGVLLPCNVVVMERDGRVTVAAVDAEAMLGTVGNADLGPIAKEINARLRAAVDSLA
jgi:uncharacterized protein (DUF302 family)